MNLDKEVNKEVDRKVKKESNTNLMDWSQHSMLEMGDYLVHLLRCVIKGETPHSKPERVTYEDLYQMAKMHNIESMVFAALESQLEAGLYQEWQQATDRNVLKSILQDEAEKELVGALSKAGIKVLALKGAIMKYLYPQEDYRQMSDIDILFEKGKDNQVRQVAEACGYTTTHFHKDRLGVYEKMPYVSVELQACLVYNHPDQQDYYDGIWERLIEDSKVKNCYYMNKEDFWIYLLVHHAKHYYEGGCGIRPVLDLYLYEQKYGDSIDWESVNHVLRGFRLLDFSQDMRGLAKAWFGEGQELDGHVRSAMESYI